MLKSLNPIVFPYNNFSQLFSFHDYHLTIVKKISFCTRTSMLTFFLYEHSEFILASVAKPVYKQFETLPTQVRIVEICENN
jgi:hypothetical protein